MICLPLREWPVMKNRPVSMAGSVMPLSEVGEDLTRKSTTRDAVNARAMILRKDAAGYAARKREEASRVSAPDHTEHRRSQRVGVHTACMGAAWVRVQSIDIKILC